MALRGPGRPPPSPLKPVGPGTGDKQLSGVEQALIRAGVAATPQEAKKLAKTLLAALRGKGVPANTLPLAIKQFQKSAGLPETGQLDPKTQAALTEAGLLPPAGDKAGADKTGGKAPAKADGPGAPARDQVVQAPSKKLGDVVGRTPDRPAAPGSGTPAGEKGHLVTLEQTKALAEHMATDAQRGPLELLENLASLGFFGAGKGADQLRDALRAFQKSAGLPTTGKIDPETAKALQDKGALPQSPHEGQGTARGAGREAAADAQAARSQSGAQSGDAKSAARGDPSTTTAHEQARSDTDQGTRDPHYRGVPEGQGDPQARAGRAAEGEGKARRKGKGGDGDATEGEGEGGVDEGDEDGTETDDTNSPAGDDDLDSRRRGHATLDDGSGDEAGHYEIPALSEQLRAALEQIERDDDGRGPVTYRWDVTFYKPGIYGAYQPAEPLWHIGIEQVTAFDDVWQQACDALARRITEKESPSAAPAWDDFERALRRARARST